MVTLRLNPDVELHCYDDDFTDPWRSAPTMLLQHGFSRSGKFWYSGVPLLAHEFRILRPDMRGMGRSTLPEDKFEPSLDIFVDDLLSILSGYRRLGLIQETVNQVFNPIAGPDREIVRTLQ